MKTAIILLALVACVWGRPQIQIPNLASILRYDFSNIGLGGYSYNVETSDGFKKEEVGELRNEGKEDESIAVQGSYSYVGPDGNVYTVNYTADENGFQPEGDHLPPSAGVKKPKLQIPSAALASLAGGGLGR